MLPTILLFFLSLKNSIMKNIGISEQVEFTYPKDDKHVYCMPKGLNIFSSKIYTILGVSGSGKSTILTLLAGLGHFSQGAIQYTFIVKNAPKAVDVKADNWAKMVGPRFWGKIGFSFQRPELIRALSVKENLELVLGKTAQEMALGLFEETEWNRIKNAKVWKLSGGQMQRLGIIRAFGKSQHIVFMDEPTNSLDKGNRQKLVDFIQKYQKDKAIILASHDKAFMDMLNIYTTFEVRDEGQLDGRTQRILRTCEK